MLMISACLIGEKCRYDGNGNESKAVLALAESRSHILVCPEVMGGLSTPRIPCEIVEKVCIDDFSKIVVSQEGLDCTAAFQKGAGMCVELAMRYQVKTAILKSKSPSCGYGHIYDGTFSKRLIAGNGLTAEALSKGGTRILNENMQLNLNILVTFLATDSQKAYLVDAFPEHNFTFISSRNATQEDLQAADVIMGNPRSGQLKNCPQLKWLQLETAGFERYVKEGVLLPHVQLSNATGCYGPAVGEHMFATTWMLLKKLHLYRDLQNKQQWQDLGSVRSLSNQKVLVVGAGDIGKHYARLVKAMGASVVGLRRSEASRETIKLSEWTHNALVKDPQGLFHGMATMKDFEALAIEADLIALCVPDNDQSRGIIHKSLLLKLKDDTVIINAGRGSAVILDDVMAVLESGKALHFGLDVTDPEPLPETHPIWQRPEVQITPHISGGDHLPETYERLVKLCERNLNAFMKFETIENKVF